MVKNVQIIEDVQTEVKSVMEPLGRGKVRNAAELMRIYVYLQV